VGHHFRRASLVLLDEILALYPGRTLEEIAGDLGVGAHRVRYVYRVALDQGLIRMVSDQDGRFGLQRVVSGESSVPASSEESVGVGLEAPPKLHNWAQKPGNAFAILKSLLDDYPRLTLREIGVRHGVTVQRVQEIRARALRYGLVAERAQDIRSQLVSQQSRGNTEEPSGSASGGGDVFAEDSESREDLEDEVWEAREQARGLVHEWLCYYGPDGEREGQHLPGIEAACRVLEHPFSCPRYWLIDASRQNEVGWYRFLRLYRKAR
jgi:hypothetical protein